jgi:hypothetical protein
VDFPEKRGSFSVIENLSIRYTGFVPTVWSPNTNYNVGDLVVSSHGPAMSHYYTMECTVAGTTGGTEPTWDSTTPLSNGQGPLTFAEGATVTDGTVTWTIKVLAAIRVHTNCKVKNINIENAPGNGMLVAANVGWNPYSNVNGTQVYDVTAQGCVLNGLFVDGPDANACLFTNYSTISCRRWGVYDSSFLGNTHTGHHTAENGTMMPITSIARVSNVTTVETARPHHLSIGSYVFMLTQSGTYNGFFYVASIVDDYTFTYANTGSDEGTPSGSNNIRIAGGAYKADDLNARSVWIGCYSESDQLPSQINAPSQVFGGLHACGFADNATAIRYTDNEVVAPTVTWRDPRPGQNPTNTRVMMPFGGGYAWNITNSVEGSTGFTLGNGTQSPSGFEGWWAWRHANLDSRMFMAWSGVGSAQGPGYLWFPAGFFVGGGYQRQYSAGSKPAGSAATLPHFGSGSFFWNWNSVPQDGGSFQHGVLGWQTGYQSSTAASVSVHTVRMPHFGFSNQKHITNGVGSPFAIDWTDHPGCTFTNMGATAKVYINLHAATGFPDARNVEYSFYVQDSDGMRIDAAGTNTYFRWGAIESSINGYLESTTVGSWVKLKLVGAQTTGQRWVITELAGTWTDGTNTYAPGVGGGGTPIDQTSNITLTNAQSGNLYTNSGATGMVTFTLPAAAAGTRFSFACVDTDGVTVQAVGSDVIYLGTNVSSAAGTLSSTTVASTIELVALSGGRWVAFGPTGSWATA